MRRLLFALLFALTIPALAQPSDEGAHMISPLNAKIEQGELRLDGTVSVVLNSNVCQLDALSWTSSSGKNTIFQAQKTKTLRLFGGTSTSTATACRMVEARRELPLVSPLSRRAELRKGLARLEWFRGDKEAAQRDVETSIADFIAANRPLDADRIRAQLQGWHAGKSPYATDAN